MIDSVLVVQPGFLGDAVLATGLLRALYQTDPAIRLGLLVRSSYLDLFAGHPAIKTLHSLDKKSADDMGRVRAEIKAADYQLAVVPHRSVRSQLIPYRADIPRRVGFRQSAFSFLCTDRAEYEIARHELQRNAALIRRVGLYSSVDSHHSWLQPDRRLEEGFRDRFGGGGKLIVVAPGSVWPTKCWPEELFGDLSGRLAERGHKVVLVGSEGERELCNRIGTMADSANVHVVAGELSLPELSALLAVANRAVTNDSAPLHIAEAVGTPVSAIFGPTVPEFGFSPYLPESSVLQVGLPCRPCGIHGHKTCPIETHECMRSVSVETVLESIT